MQVNLYINASMIEATKDMINAMDNSDFSVDHIIVVPDRFSLQMEKLVLSLLPQKALFNVRVVGLSTLANEIIEENGERVEVLTSAETLLLTQKAIKNVKDDLFVFNKINISFCYEISKIIAQLKSSMVDGESLNEKAVNVSGKKYHDLKLIYNEYEALRQKHDANSRFQHAADIAEKSEFLKNSKLYFAQFDAFTKEGYFFLQQVIKAAIEVNISLAKAIDIGNEYIYERDIEDKLISLAQSQNCRVNVIVKNTKFSAEKEAILKGVYSYKKTSCPNNGFFELFSASSVTEEVSSVAKLIYNYTVNGARYSDITVMCGDINKYSNKIENIFQKFDIPFYIDSSITADQTLLFNLISTFFSVVDSGYASDSLTNLFSNILISKDEELIKKVKKYSIDNKFRYKTFIANENKFDYLLTKIESCKTSKDFSKVVKEIVETFKPMVDNLLSQMNDKGLVKEKNLNEQIYDIIDEALALIEEYEDEITIDEYLKKLKLILSFKNISTVPSFVDGVLVGDATTTPSLENKIVIIIGAHLLPITNSDNGFLSDDDLMSNFAQKQIEPTIKMINRRNRFKLFNLLANANKKLVITYQTTNDEGKKNEVPTFISSLCEIFSVESKRMSDLFDRKKNYDLLSLGNRKNFVSENYFAIDEKTKNELGINEELFIPDKKNISCQTSDFIFNNESARVTQIEQYFSCPFKHFVTYGLKLKEEQTGEFEVNDIGNVCHRFCEIFVKEIIKNNYQKNIVIDEFIEKNFRQVLVDERLDEKFDLLVNKVYFEKYLKHQLKIILSDIVREMQHSAFKPKYIEEKFSNITVGSKKQVKLVGKADRIDECGDYFRIIDYKTGTTGSIKEQLYYGEKVQLFLYQKAFRERYGKVPAGVFYFNAKYEYAKNEEDKKILKGLVAKDDEVIPLIDNDIDLNGKSDLINLSTAKSKGEKYKGAIAKNAMSFYENYAYQITNKAVDEIMEGFIEPKPNEESCKYCKYASICGYENSQGKRKKKKIGDFDVEK